VLLKRQGGRKRNFAGAGDIKGRKVWRNGHIPQRGLRRKKKDLLFCSGGRRRTEKIPDRIRGGGWNTLPDLNTFGSGYGEKKRVKRRGREKIDGTLWYQQVWENRVENHGLKGQDGLT